MLIEPRVAGGPFIAHGVCGSGLHANVRVRGDLDAERVPMLANELDTLVASGVREIRIDLDPMAFVDRVAHQVLADAATHLNDLGGRLALTRSAS